jgi:ABC-type amino acid transport substrate-binding protein
MLPAVPAPFPPDIQRIKDRGKLVVAMFHHDRPPFFYTDAKGQLAGLEVEMAADIARRLGVAVEFNRDSSSFDGVVDLVVSGRADVAISKVSMTLARALRVAYTDPYLVFHHALLINRLQLAALRAKNPGKSVLELLAAAPHKIGVRGASAWAAYAEQSFPRARIVVAEEMAELVAAAAHGETLALLYDEFELKKFMNTHPGLNIDLQLLLLHQQIDPIGIAVNSEDRHLLAWLNLYLSQGTGALRINELRREYGQARIRPEGTEGRK